MNIQTLNEDFTVCQITDLSQVKTDSNYYFIGKTLEELSLVCKTEDTPSNTSNREDGWQGFKIEGILDFSLIGILAKISTLLAENSISIFAVSTYNTDYIFVRNENYQKALNVLTTNGYTII